MDSPGTPNKKQKTEAVAASPSSKMTLDFDYWADRRRKVSKTLEGDLAIAEQEICVLKDLELGKSVDKAIKALCFQVSTTVNVMKVAFEDESGIMIAVAFPEHMKALEHVQAGKWYTVGGTFEIQKENPKFPTGAVNKNQIVVKAVKDVTVIKESTSPGELPLNLKTLKEVKELPKDSDVDVLAICVKDWGQSISENGKKRWQLTLTDKSMQSIRLTVWGDLGLKLIECEENTMLLRHVGVAMYDGVNYLQTKWFSDIETQPLMDDAYELKKWFEQEKDAE